MPSGKLPAYFREYLDEKFSHTYDKINSVDEKVNGALIELKKINGDLSGVKREQLRVVAAQKAKIPEYERMVRDTKNNRKLILIILFVAFALFVVACRENIAGTLKLVPMIIGAL